MSETTNRQINIFINSGEAQKAYDKLIEKEQRLKKTIAETNDPRVRARAIKDLDAMGDAVDRAAKKVSGQLGPSLKDLQTTVRNLGNQFKHLSENDANFSKVLGQLNRAKAELAAMQAQMRGTDRSAGNSIFSGAFWGSLAAGVINRVTQQLQQVVGQAFEWALQLEGVQAAYNKLNKPDLLDDLRKATRGTVSDLELMKQAVKFSNFKLPLDQMGTLLEFASRRARETGESVDYLVQSITLGIARKSIPIMDNLGISASQLREEFEKTGDFATASFNIVNTELERMGPAVETNADKVDRLKASWQNFWTTAGAGAVTIGDNIVNFFDRLFDTANHRQKEAAQKLAAANQAAYENELRLLEDYKGRLALADEDGRQRIIEQVQGEIRTTQQLRDKAFADGLTDQVNQFDRYLDLWKNFLGKIKENAAGGNTLAGLNEELKNLNEQLNNTQIGSAAFKELQKEIKRVQKEIDDANGKVDKVATKAFDKIKADRERLAKELEKQAFEQQLREFNDLEKEMARLARHYDELRLLAHGNKEQLKKLEENYWIEVDAIQLKWFRKMKEEKTKADKAMMDKLAADAEKGLKESLERQQKIIDQFSRLAERYGRNRVAGKEVDVEVAKQKHQLKQVRNATLELLKEQEVQELAAKDHTENEKRLIEIKYQQLRRQAELDYQQQLAETIIGGVEQVMGIFNAFADARTSRENAELEADRQRNEKKKNNYDRQLKAGLISRLEYDRQINELDKKADQKERQIRLRQFQRDQRAQVVQALISGANAYMTNLSKFGAPIPPNFVAIAAQAFTVAATAAQVAAIASRKPPQFARGGKLHGPSHAENNGMPVMDPRTGRVNAYLEGGEGITNKRTMADRRHYRVAGTPSQIISALNALHGGVHWEQGATLRPSWKTSQHSAIDFSRINASMRGVRMYAQGGRFAEGSTTETSNNEALAQTLAELNRQLAMGIRAKTYISENEAAQDRLNAIRRDATLK